MFTTTYIIVYYSFFKDTNWLFSNEKFLRRETDRIENKEQVYMCFYMFTFILDKDNKKLLPYYTKP